MHTGALVEKIDKQGSGPDEYNRIDDLYVDEALQYIEVLDGSTQKVLRYDLTGEFIKSTKLPFRFNSFSKIKLPKAYWESENPVLFSYSLI